MDKWLHAQFKVAENILEAVDRNISKNVNTGPPGSTEWTGSSLKDANDSGDTDPAVSPKSFAVSTRHAPEFENVRSGSLDLPKSNNLGTTSVASNPNASRDSSPPRFSAVSDIRPHFASFMPAPPEINVSKLPDVVKSFAAIPSASSTPKEQGPQITGAAQELPVTLQLETATDGPVSHWSLTDIDQSNSDISAVGNNRESRLTRLVEHLRRRLEEQRAENQQLERLLQKAEARATAEAHLAQRLQAHADRTAEDRSSLESTTAAQLTAKEVEMSKLRSSLDAAQRQLALLEAAKALLEERNAVLQQGQEQVEAGMLEALKAELKSVELQLESERRQHQSSKASASSRQEELEQHLADSAAALSSMQRKLEQAVARNLELEERLMLQQAQHKQMLEQPDASSLNKTDGTPTMRLSSSGGLEGPSLVVEALREEVARSRAAAQAAEKAQRMAETSAANLRQELVELRSGTNQPTTQLEHEVKEMSEMLYIKQTQLERLAAEKASQQLVLERDLMTAREEVNRLRASSQQRYDTRHTNDTLIPMDALGEPYQRLARHNKLGATVTTVARFLDTTTTRFVYILRHYPLGRLIVFLYIVVMHLCLYLMTIRMQHLAMRQEAVGPPVLTQPDSTLLGQTRGS